MKHVGPSRSRGVVSKITVPNTQDVPQRNRFRAVSPEPTPDDAASHSLHNRAVPTCDATPPSTRGSQHRLHVSISPPLPLLRQRSRPFPPPSPRVPMVIPEDNSYTGANDRGCAGETLSTAHQYPTFLSQHLINNLCTPSTNQSSAQSTYSIAANIITVISADAVINEVLYP